MSLVYASQLFCDRALPERICTTDFFHDVAEVGQHRGARMYLLGGTEAAIGQAPRRVKLVYPDLDIVGFASGYMRREDEEVKFIEAINAARPDISGSVLEFRSSNSSRCAIAVGCAASA